MTSAKPRPRKLFSKFLLTAVFIVGLSGITATAEDYYDNDQSSESGMFFYDYADESGPEAPPAPIDLEPRQSPQLIIVAPPVSEEEYAEPVITRPAPAVKKKKTAPPQPAQKEAVPVQAPVPAKAKTKPVESVPDQAQVPARSKAAAPDSRKKQPIVNKTLFSENRPVSQPEAVLMLEPITIAPVAPVSQGKPAAMPEPVTLAPFASVSSTAPAYPASSPPANSATSNAVHTAHTPREKNGITPAAGNNESTGMLSTGPMSLIEAGKKVGMPTDQPENSALRNKSQVTEQVQKHEMEPAQSEKQKPAANYSPPVIEKLEVEEFVAAVAPGKPTIDAAGNVIHFYSDPMPLVAEPPPDPDYDPDFADFELSRVLPVIDAPDGLYKFSLAGDGIQIVASHTYDNVPVQAGQIVALNMLVTNNSGRRQTFSETVTGPAGVRGIHEVAPFVIEDGQVLSRRIALHLDSSLTAGEHSVSYTVSAANASATRGTLSCWFAIRALPRLQFEIASAPLLVENAPFKVSGKLINSGNTGLNVMLNLKGRQKGLQISPARISLPSGGHAIIELAGTTPARSHPLDDILHMQLLAITDTKSGSIQLLDEPVKLRITSKN